MSRTAVALSGGGHRACLFALGVLCYLADAGKNREVTSVASVSGGSFANGVVAQSIKYQSATPDEVKAVVARTAHQIATKGTVFASPITWAYLALLAILVVIAVVGPWLLPLPPGLKVVLFVFGLLIVGFVAALRGGVCARAFGRTLFSPEGRPTRLSEVNAEVDHVVCATDLHAGEHVYFSGRFVCGYRFGFGVPGDLPLHTAVQASAAFPGAFPVTWLATKRHQFKQPAEPAAAATKTMALVDGGVYDNMGDQWAQGLETRARRWSSLNPGFSEADELVVVSASAGLSWGSVEPLRLPLIGELLMLFRDKSVLYDNGNSVRRRELVARFDLAEREGNGLRGTLVHIPQSPFDVPDFFKSANAQWPDRARRAQAVIAQLGDTATTREEWKQVAKDNAAVATTLVRFSAEVCARLLHHAYVLAMANAHVILGYPLLEIPDREYFGRIVEEGV